MTPEQIERLREWLKANCSFDKANEIFPIIGVLSVVFNADLGMRYYAEERKVCVDLNGELISEVTEAL